MVDHKPLLFIFGSKKGIPTHTANRLQKFSIILLNYNFKMEYISSKKKKKKKKKKMDTQMVSRD